MEPHDKTISEVKPYDYHTFIDTPSDETLIPIPDTPEKQQFVLSKAKIAGGVTISLALITAGVTLGIHFSKCYE
jgi:hypothetical protein